MSCVTSGSVVLARNSHSVPHTCKGDEKKRALCPGTPVLSPEVLIGRHTLNACGNTLLPCAVVIICDISDSDGERKPSSKYRSGTEKTGMNMP